MDAVYLFASWVVGGIVAGKIINKLSCTILAYACIGFLGGYPGVKILTYFGVSPGGSGPQEPAGILFNLMAGFVGGVVGIIIIMILKPLLGKKPKVETDQECWKKVKRQTP